jgi:hypothetical protein
LNEYFIAKFKNYGEEASILFLAIVKWKYKVQQFISRNGCSVLLGCWVRQIHVPKHVWTCPNLRLHEPQTNWVICSLAAAVVRLWSTVDRKMSDKNLEQRINVKFCVKIGKSASEILALLTVAYGEYAMKKLNVF